MKQYFLDDLQALKMVINTSKFSDLAENFDKAAREMKERLAFYLGEQTVQKLWVGTFHSICGRILRQDIDKYTFQSGKKLDKNFTIYDEQDSLAVIKQAVAIASVTRTVYHLNSKPNISNRTGFIHFLLTSSYYIY